MIVVFTYDLISNNKGKLYEKVTISLLLAKHESINLD